MRLPQTVCGWIRTESIKTITAESIFDYMDGAGELYLGYRFDRLEVIFYHRPEQENIIVEQYFMKSPEDAFGLFSLDWNGQPMDLSEEDSMRSVSVGETQVRALYAAGLLRFWSGNLYGRIMAYHETAESQEAVIALGKACTQEYRPDDMPGWIRSLPTTLCDAWTLEKDQIRFLRTHLVFNSVYFLSFSNILNLDLYTEIAAGRYCTAQKNANHRFYIFTIRYASPEKAKEALAGFHRAYYPESPMKPEEISLNQPVVQFTESNWSGYILDGSHAVLGFEFSDGPLLERALREMIAFIERMQ